jgi:predicted N-acetyltransferase YhbS
MTGDERRALSRPVALKPGHDVAAFDCGRAELTSWIKEWGHRASDNDTARTFVVCRGTKKVVAYFSLAAGAVDHLDDATGERVPRRLRQNAPDPIPVIVLGRLAVDKEEQGQKLGSALVGEAMRRAAQAARLVGARALLVHALDDPLVRYYETLGFIRFSPISRTLYLPMKTIRDGL